MNDVLLRVDDLSVEYETRGGPLKAVDNVSFCVYRSEILGIVGESGCGKSTSARAILNLIDHPGRISGGSVHLADLGNLTAMRKSELRSVRGAHVGYISQNPFGSLNPILSIERQFRNVFAAHRGRTSRSVVREAAVAQLRAVGINRPERVLDGYAHELSGGMAQRVVIAMASLLDPRLLIADEPTTGLDVTVQRQILDLVQGLARSEGRGIILVTHDLGVVAQYCDRVCVMYAGRIVEVGPVDDVFSHPAHPYTKALIDSVPRSDQELRQLRGGVPTLVNREPGCAFANRCDFAFDACGVDPILREGGLNRQVACHLEQGVDDRVAG